jgi:hypothetical protein
MNYDLKLSNRLEKLKNKIQEKIRYCYNCQAYEGGQIFWILGRQYDLEYIFDEFEIPENKRDVIASSLHCLYCGTELQRFDSVGLENKFDEEIRRFIDLAIKTYGNKIIELENLLKQFPTLALQSSLAKRIQKEIRENKLETCSLSGLFYRARKIVSSDILKPKDFLAPPQGKSEEGRFNHSGQSHLYISSDKETAISECIGEKAATLLWLQEFDLKQIKNILDLTLDWDKIGPSSSTLFIALHESGILMKTKDNKNLWKPEYCITRFIMDCAKQSGYEGIKYFSSRNITGINTVIFNPKENIFKKLFTPQIVIHNPDSSKKIFAKFPNV